MQDLIQAPVRVDNDANTAALAEAVCGAGRKSNPVFYVTPGSGVGGGFVSDRLVVHGTIPGEAEIGHIRLDKSGLTVEQRCSGWAVDQRIQKALPEHPASKLHAFIGRNKGGEARFLQKAIEEGDALARKILDETAEDLGFALSHVTHLLHPELIVLGGGLSLMGELLREAVARHHRRFIMNAFQPGPEIRIAQLGEDVVPIGALLLAKGNR
jgi:glucokinase